MKSCGEWNTIIEEAAALGVGAASARRGAAGRTFPLEDLSGASRAGPARRHWDRRTRSGRRRRICAGLRDTDRRRARHRQVDSADSSLRGGGALRRAGRLRFGRGIDRPDPSPRRPPRAGDRSGSTRGPDSGRGHRGDAGVGRRTEIRGHQFDPDHVERRDRIGAGNGQPGAGLGPSADSLRQSERRGASACRACHQGRPDRGPARGRAHGGRGLLVRGRRSARVSSFAGGQEPLRRHRRGRRLRNDRRRPCRGAEPVGAVSGRAGRRREPGASVFAGVEGARPLLVEIQALVAPTSLGTPRRAVVGWEPSRLAMVLAVLESHGGLKLGQYDVYLNVAGGLRVAEPAADLAAAAALVSSLAGAPCPMTRSISARSRCRGRCGRRSRRPPAEGGGQARLRARLRPARRHARRASAGAAITPIGSVAWLVAVIAAAAVEAKRPRRLQVGRDCRRAAG